MKVSCESCGAQYDLDDSRIPPSGITMKCPACLHQFKVMRAGAAVVPPPPATPAKREIALSSMDETDLPAPKAAVPPPMPPKPATPPPKPPASDDAVVSIGVALTDDGVDLPGPVQRDVVDLPAPVGAKSPATKPSLPAIKPPAPAIKPPAPVAKPPAPATKPNMPAAKPPMPAAKPVVPPPPSAKKPDIVDLPAPVHKKPGDIVDLPAPVGAKATQPQGIVDLPAPVTKRPDIIDLPAPKSPAAPGSIPLSGPDTIDVVAPKRAVGPLDVDLDAPDADDDSIGLPPVPPRLGELGDDGGPPAVGLELDTIDVVAPKQETMDLAPKHETMDVAPKQETLDVAPKRETMDVAPKRETMDVAPKMGVSPGPESLGDHSLDDPTPVEAQKLEVPRKGERKAQPAGQPDKPKRKLGRVLLIAGIGVLLLGGVGVGMGVFTDSGFFGANLFGKPKGDSEAKLTAARKLMIDDTLTSYRKASVDLQPLVDEQPNGIDALAIKAQAHLMAARLGLPSEIKAADALLAKIDTIKTEVAVPEADKARALKSLVAGKLADARSKLNSVLGAAPSDATALVYLGWTELAAGDLDAADKAFGKAVAAEGTRTAALYGAGLTKERAGDLTAAQDLYTRALGRSPNHFGVAVGQARVSARKGAGAQAAQAKIEDLINKRSAVIGPREAADGWASVGAIAAAAGRRDEAEDRLKRALGLDPTNSGARVLLSGVMCQTGRAKETVEPLQKIVMAEPKNLDARLMLARAKVESGSITEVPALLQQAVAQAPKDARVLYWMGRLLLAQERPDRDKALGMFKDSIAADQRYIPAYLEASNTFAALGKPDDALDTLRQAEQRASDDPQMMTELGQAYLSINRATDAEARFRAALEKKPDMYAARVLLGAALEAQGRLEDARLEYAAVEKVEPLFPGLAERRARLMTRLGKKTEAWELYQSALKQGVPPQSMRMAAASLGLELGKTDEARTLIESVLREDDRSANAQLLLAKSYLIANRPEDAMSSARRAATLADLPEAHLVLAQAIEKLGKLDQAMSEYNLARRPPVESDASLGRARILVRMGATRDALAELAVLAKEPRLRASALMLTGDCYTDLRENDRARGAYEQAVKAAPDNGEAAFKLGRVYIDVGKRKPGVEMLDKALKLGGDKASYATEAYLLAGDTYRELKQNADAVRTYKKYLELAPADARARGEVEKHIANLGSR
jgi:cellulose synthase operon protein C